MGSREAESTFPDHPFAIKASRAGQVGDPERLRLTGVGEMPRTQQVTLRRDNTHPA